MYTQRKTILTIFFELLVLLFLSTNCSIMPDHKDAAPTRQFVAATLVLDKTFIVPKLTPTPEYLFSLYPTGTISKEKYDSSLNSSMEMGRGIVVTIWSDLVGLSGDDFRANPEISKRMVELYLNGVRISNTSLRIADGLMKHGPFYLSWAPQLMMGLYEAKFQLTTGSGQTFEYVWQFIVVE